MKQSINHSCTLPQLIVLLDKGFHILLTLLLHGEQLPLLELAQLGVQLLHRLVREELLLRHLPSTLLKLFLLLFVPLQVAVLGVELGLEPLVAGLLVGDLLGLGRNLILDVPELLHEWVGGGLELGELLSAVLEMFLLLFHQVTD